MEKQKQQTAIVPISGTIVSESTLGLDDPEIIEAEVITEEEWEAIKHPNFIESNTSAISFDDLTNRNIIPTFSDNTLTLSHHAFAGSVYRVAEQVFGELTPIECRVSHPIIGRIPSAQHKKANELLDHEKTVSASFTPWIS